MVNIGTSRFFWNEVVVFVIDVFVLDMLLMFAKVYILHSTIKLDHLILPHNFFLKIFMDLNV